MDNQLILTQKSQGDGIRYQAEHSSSNSNDMSISQQKMRVAFVNRQEARLYQLIRERHIFVDSSSIVWVDENGLLTAQDMSGELPKKPVPLFHAGPSADVNKISISLASPRHFWGQANIEEDTPICGPLIKKLVVKEMILFPFITHLSWKKLLTDLESSTDVATSPSAIVKKVKDAMNQEENDLEEITYFEACCREKDEFLRMNLTNFSQAMYRLAGVDIYQSQSWPTLRAIDEDLANKISNISHLANKTQTQRALPDKLSFLSETAHQLCLFFYNQRRGPKMEQLLEAVKKQEDNMF